jgi:hypothetical protein
LAEEITNVGTPETPAEPTPEAAEAPGTVDLDQKVRVGGEEYSAKELADTHQNYNELQEYAQNLEAFQQATVRLMDPSTDPETRKNKMPETSCLLPTIRPKRSTSGSRFTIRSLKWQKKPTVNPPLRLQTPPSSRRLRETTKNS